MMAWGSFAPMGHPIAGGGAVKNREGGLNPLGPGRPGGRRVSGTTAPARDSSLASELRSPGFDAFDEGHSRPADAQGKAEGVNSQPPPSPPGEGGSERSEGDGWGSPKRQRTPSAALARPHIPTRRCCASSALPRRGGKGYSDAS